MDIYTVSQARKNIYKLIDSVAASHRPACIAGKRNKVVVVSAEDFSSLQETLYILSVPGMRESIEEGRQESLQECPKELLWE